MMKVRIMATGVASFLFVASRILESRGGGSDSHVDPTEETVAADGSSQFVDIL